MVGLFFSGVDRTLAVEPRNRVVVGRKLVVDTVVVDIVAAAAVVVAETVAVPEVVADMVAVPALQNFLDFDLNSPALDHQELHLLITYKNVFEKLSP